MTDVIPPFDKSPLQAGAPDDGAEELTLAQAREQQPKRQRKASRPPERGTDGGSTHPAEQPPADSVVPTFDLAEHILAEHRRTASRRRKAPGQGRVEPEPTPEPAVVAKTCVAELSPPPSLSPDARDLHQVVADIVARDIERLCRQPGRPPRD